MVGCHDASQYRRGVQKVDLKVIGAGVGRTGTLSLKLALEQLLKGRCHHMIELFREPDQISFWVSAIDGETTDWARGLRGYVAQVDWPGASFWRELSGAFPEALVVLSVRDPQSWYDSCMRTIFSEIPRQIDEGDEWVSAFARMSARRFSDRFADREAMIAAYLDHNAAVRATVPADRLLEWSVADGWRPLCDRLGLRVPKTPFPQANSTAEFRARAGLPPLAT